MEAGDEITMDLLEALELNKISKLPILEIDQNTGAFIRDTLKVDKNQTKERHWLISID